MPLISTLPIDAFEHATSREASWTIEGASKEQTREYTVTGYVTPAAVYCAITGGTYTVTGQSNSGDEQGTCTFPNGATCDVWEYYNGTCSAGEPSSALN